MLQPLVDTKNFPAASFPLLRALVRPVSYFVGCKVTPFTDFRDRRQIEAECIELEPRGRSPEREFILDKLQVPVHFIIETARWIGLAPCEFEFPFPCNLASTFLPSPNPPPISSVAFSNSTARAPQQILHEKGIKLQPFWH